MTTNNESSEFSTEFWTATAGDLSQKREQIATPKFGDADQAAAKIVIDPSEKHQDWLGQGAAITDSAASLIWGVLNKDQRDSLLHELFDPTQGAFQLFGYPLDRVIFQVKITTLTMMYRLANMILSLKNFPLVRVSRGHLMRPKI